MTNSSDRLDRIEQILERLAQNQRQIVQAQGEIVQAHGGIVQNLERILQIQERQQDQIEALVNAATRHESIISRLDAILERLIYREGRSNGDQPPAT